MNAETIVLSAHRDQDAVSIMVNAQELPPTVARACMMRMRAARPQYGELNLATDKRDFLHEAYEEILDAINYVAMHELQGHSVPLIRFGLKALAWAFSTLRGGK